MISNVTDNSVKLAAESVDVTDHVCLVFEAASSTKKEHSSKHSCLSFEKDLRLILGTLQEQEYFTKEGITKPKRVT